MGMLQSLLRGSTIPPEDTWFAGETVQYYYGGHFLASLLARITGTEARFAYNLALSGFFAMLVTGVYGVAGSIAAHRGFSKVRAGAFGAFLVGFASNLFTPGKYLLGKLPLGESLAGVFGVETTGEFQSLAAFDYWNASRVIPVTINEFPLFAWYNGDLHAHMMSTPFLVVVVGLLAGLYVDGTDRPLRQRAAVVFGVLPALAGLLAVTNTWSFPTVGGLVAVALTIAVPPPIPGFSGFARSREGSSGAAVLGGRLLAALGSGVAVLLVGVVWSLPFWLAIGVGGGGGGNTLGFLPDRSGMGVLLVVHGAFLLVSWLYSYRHLKPHAGQPLRVVTLLLTIVALTVVAGAPAVGVFVPLILFGWLLLALGDVDGVPTVTLGPAAADGGTPTNESDAPAWLSPGFELVVLVSAAGLAVLVEFVYLSENFAPGRFNTVFKVYMQVWVLLSIAGGVVLARLLSTAEWPALTDAAGARGRNALVVGGIALTIAVEYVLVKMAVTPSWLPGIVGLVVQIAVGALVGVGLVVLVQRIRTAEMPTELGFSGPRAGTAMVVVVVLVVASTSLYGVLATEELLNDHGTSHEDPTLDSLAFLTQDPYIGDYGGAHPEEAPAIEYLLSEVDGQPNMVSYGPGEAYRWTNGAASLTGVPTLVGWSQERGYRSPEAFEQRVADVETIYLGSPDRQRALLKQYDVELIYFGPTEQREYGYTTVDDLEAVSVEKSWDGVTLYRVDQSAL
ncbi:hypothetical protein GJ629_05155 [Halapricum sp. CBA1109]|uniref:DUF2298 domain-containing protein n=1 Tax=Halapricum sp. CBA1109 TaxID=2668068 RepID=UPI0012FA8EBA|nr:DUF2298 domain-containing protein [Halapricum sp. CBA1109]MUV89366.1 hypothetical protein [Halapricum sp. CBA1109]